MPSSKKNRITALLLEEHSKVQTNRIVKLLNKDRSLLTQLWDNFYSNELIQAQRAAWVVHHYYIQCPNDILEQLPALLPLLKRPLHPAQLRNVLRILSECEVPEEFHGPLLDLCLNNFIQHNTPSAIRVFALNTASNIAMKYPEIAEELIGTVEGLEESSAGIKSRWRKLRPKLKQVISQNQDESH